MFAWHPIILIGWTRRSIGHQNVLALDPGKSVLCMRLMSSEDEVGLTKDHIALRPAYTWGKIQVVVLDGTGGVEQNARPRREVSPGA